MMRAAAIAAAGICLFFAGPACAQLVQPAPAQALPSPYKAPLSINVPPGPAPMGMTVVDEGTKIQRTADDQSLTLGALESGTKVQILGTDGDWTHVISGGMDGFVKTRSLR